VGDFADIDVDRAVVESIACLVDVWSGAKEGGIVGGHVALEEEAEVASGALGEDGQEAVFFQPVENGLI
jgi:hypothetical protein